MQWVGRALSSVSQYYKEINPATLSGAVDVIVVEHEDPKDGSKTLACSPFHVRFGKLSVLRPVDRTVYVKINETDAPYQMKVGDTGEAFFVFETDQDVPADMQTSPITGPVQDDEGEEEPEDLQLGESVAGLPLQHEASQQPLDDAAKAEAEKNEIEGKHISKTSRLLEGAAARLQDTGKGLIDSAVITDRLDKVSGQLASHLPHHSEDGDVEAGTAGPGAVLRGMQKKNAVTEEAFVASEYAGQPSPSVGGSESPKPFGAGVSSPDDDDDHFNLDQHASASTMHRSTSTSHVQEPTKSSYYSTGSFTPPATDSLQHELMLDIAGYKTQEQDDKEGDGLKTPPELSNAQVDLQERITEGKAKELHERDPDVFALTRALLRYSESKETQVKGQHRQPLNAISTDPSATFSEVNRAAADPHMFLLISEGEQYIFEIAICPDVPVKTSGALPSIEDFNSHRITNEQLLKDADILQNQHLFVRFRERCFGWENGHTVLATLDLYRRALLEAQPKPASKGTWSRWWGRGQNRARTTTSDSVPTISGETQDSRSQNGQAANMDSLTVHNELTRSSTAPDLSKNPPPLLSSPSSPDLPTNAQATSADTAAVQSNSLVATMAQQKHYAKTLRLTSDQLKALNLKKGANSVSFTVQSSFSGVAVITARIFLWQSDYQIVISDIDGTITKSDALGHVFTMIGRDWTHPGVANLYTDIARNGYKMLYLTSRAVGQADITREYLRGVQQNGFTLPEGPVIMSPDRLFTSLHREVVLRKPEAFKMACLRDIKRLFVDRNPFYAGFGNRLTDGLSYRHVEIPSSRIFTIDSYGNVKLELLELAGYTSTYIAMANLVDETFPPVNRSSQPAFNDFNYWRPALPDIDLPDLTPQPASPALSARSDSSRMSVFRVGALAGALSKRSSRAQLKNTAEHDGGGGSGTKSPLSTSPRSTSPSPLQTVYNREDMDITTSTTERNNNDQTRRRRERTESMPGSFEEESYLNGMRDSQELNADNQSLRSSRTGGSEHDDGEEDDGSDEEDEGQENTLDEDDLPDIDFGSVPYL